MASLRKKASDDFYKQRIAEGILDGECRLCVEPAVRSFTHWKIIPNAYPYDRIAAVHDMIMPIRHVTESELNAEEIEELNQIKKEHLHQEYDFMMEATTRVKTIPAHFHLHLIVVNEE